jgi:DegV family protein with EDD domain
MPHAVALITDSSNDLPDALLAQYEIAYVPLYVLWGQDQLNDRTELTAAQFYHRLVNDAVFPKTAQPTPQDFARAYAQAEQAGAQAIVAVVISGAMSGTYRSASQAVQGAGVPVRVVDAHGPTMTVGWQALAAARAREALEAQGASVQEIAEGMVLAAEKARARMVQWVCMDTLEFLYKGGRIGGASRLIGSVLKLKPLVYIDHVAGIVESGPKVRTRQRSIEALYEGFFHDLDTTRPRLHIAVLHGDAEAEALALAERIRGAYPQAELLVGSTTPVMGVHTGPGALCLAGYAED